VITREGALIAILSWAFDVVPAESFTCTVKALVPGAVGVPLIVPLPLKERPGGSEPAVTDHVYPPVPPLAASVCE
jgi:hypothetical protein